MATFVLDLVTLLLQRQAVDLHHVVQHAGEDAHHFAVLVPVETRFRAEGVNDEGGQIDRAQQAGAVGWQWLLAAGVGRPDRFAPPVVVQLVDAIDEDEARLGVVVGGDHDHVPQMTRLHPAVDAAGDQAVVAHDIALVGGPFAPDDLLGVVQVQLGLFLEVQREDQRPFGVVLHRLHELVGDQQAEVELAQATVFALGADEFAHVRMADIEGAHLRAAASAGGADGEAHLVEDIHERQRPAGMRAGPGDEGAARAQGAEFVADAATGLERQPGLVDLAENLVHRVVDGAGNSAVDGRGGRLVVLRAGVGNDPPGRNGAVAQRPEEALVPRLALAFRLDVRQGAGDPLPGGVDAIVDGGAVLAGQAILLRPDVFGSQLQGDARSVLDFCRDRPARLRHALRILMQMGKAQA